MSRVDRECQWCGRSFKAPAYKVARGHGRFCSLPCSRAGKAAEAKRDGRFRGEKNPAWKGGVNRDRERAARFKRLNPEKVAAHRAVRAAIRAGVLVREPCEGCGAEHAEAHHNDYTEPLAVEWLCRQCHVRHHAAQPQAGKASK